MMAVDIFLPSGGVEMAKLTAEQRDNRLRFDYQVTSQMQSPIMEIAAYRSAEDLRAQRNPITAVEEGHQAKHYLAHYHVKTLIGPDRYSLNTSVHFDLLAQGDYPYTEPVGWVISDKIPWTPHFLTGKPICLGPIWKSSQGRMLFGQLLVHVAKLLNFDEVPREKNYVGWNPKAIEYWRTTLNMQPITPELIYPVLPNLSPTSIPVQDQNNPTPSLRFRPKPQSPPQSPPPPLLPPSASIFKPKSAADEPQQIMFAPSRRDPS
jgi:hypothetical protein